MYNDDERGGKMENPKNKIEIENQKENKEQIKITICAVVLGLLVIIGFLIYESSNFSISSWFNSGDAKDAAIHAARAKGYAVYEDTVRVEESDKYGRYFITMNSRASSLNIKLICYVELLDNYQFMYIVCPDTFENIGERTQWKNDVKSNNGWGSSAK